MKLDLELDTLSQDELRERIEDTLTLIVSIGGYDGSHHKQYCIDQIVRILTGCPTESITDTDSSGIEFEYDELVPNDSYRNWVKLYEYGEDGPETYIWDEGIAP